MEDLQPLPDGSLPLSFLLPPRQGFLCPHCPEFRTLHEREVRHHSIKAHDRRVKPREVQKHACHLQGWIRRHARLSKRYWIVDTNASPGVCCSIVSHEPVEVLHDAEVEQRKLEAEEEERIRQDPEAAIHEDLAPCVWVGSLV